MSAQAHAFTAQAHVFIDASLPDLATLRAGLSADAIVHLLDPAQDGLQQIAAALAGTHNIPALHLITHGAPGQLHLGERRITTTEFGAYRAELQAISNAMREDGELLIYGCEVAAGREGRLFADALAERTGLKVAAATHKVGAAELGGDWDLNVGLPPNRALRVADWGHVLAAPANGVYTFANAVDIGGSTYYTTADGFFLIRAVSGEFADAGDDLVYADGDGASLLVTGEYGSGSAPASPTSYLEVTPADTGSFILNSAVIGETFTDIADDNDYTNIYLVGYANDVEVARTATYSSVDLLESTYTFPTDYFSPFSNKYIDTIRLYFDTPTGDIADRITLISMDISGASTDPAPASGAAPTLTAFEALANATEDTAKTITFEDLQTAGNEADSDGTVTGFVVKSVTSGTLTIGGQAWNATTNNTIDSGKSASWTPATDKNGSALEAFTVVAKDNTGAESATPVAVTVNVAAVNDAPGPQIGSGILVKDWSTDSAAVDSRSYSLTVLQDGSVMLGGVDYGPWTGSDFAFTDKTVVRVGANGLLDTSFGGDGKVVLSGVSGGTFENATALAQQPDGKILVGGVQSNAFIGVLQRLNADGTPDTTFNGGNPMVLSNLSLVESIVVLDNGDFLVAGRVNENVINNRTLPVYRFNADGSPDTDFSGDGLATFALPINTAATEWKMQRLGDGTLVLSAREFGANGVLIAHVDAATGSPAMWGTDGFVYNANLNATNLEQFRKLLINDDGTMFAVGDHASGKEYKVFKLDANGVVDSSWGSNGVVALRPTYNTGEPWNEDRDILDYLSDAVVQPDGKIVLAGSGNDSTGSITVVMRLNANGELDTSFNGTGQLIFDQDPTQQAQNGSQILSANDDVVSLGLLPDGTIVLAGQVARVPDNETSQTFVRISPDGVLDPTSGSFTGSLTNSIAYTEGVTPVALYTEATVFDVDLYQAGNYAGATITLSRDGGADADDQFSALTGSNLVMTGASGNVVLSGTTIGTFTNASGTLAITFNANATQVRLNEALRSIAYENGSDTPDESVTINWVFNDGNTGAQGTGAAESLTIATRVTITATNDNPILDASKAPALPATTGGADAPTNGSTTGSILVSALVNSTGIANYSDAEGDLPGVAITGVKGGVLWFSTNDGDTWTEVGSASDGSALVLNADATTRVYFQADSDASGTITDALTIRAWDRTGSAANGETGVVAAVYVGAELDAVTDGNDSGPYLKEMVSSGNYVYAFDDNNDALMVFNVSDPNNVSWVRSVSLDDRARDIKTDGTNVYVANDNAGGVQIFAISDLTGNAATVNPIGNYLDANGNQIYSVEIDGTTAYAGVRNVGVVKLDISTPATPQVVATKTFADRPDDMAKIGNYLYVVSSSTNAIQILDTTDFVADAVALDLGSQSIYPKGIAKHDGMIWIWADGFDAQSNNQTAVHGFAIDSATGALTRTIVLDTTNSQDSWKGYPYGVSFSGTTAYVATEYSVLSYDLSGTPDSEVNGLKTFATPSGRFDTNVDGQWFPSVLATSNGLFTGFSNGNLLSLEFSAVANAPFSAETDTVLVEVAAAPTSSVTLDVGNPFTSDATDSTPVTITAPDGINITNASNSAVSGLPKNVKMPLGQFGFTLEGVEVGGTVQMSMTADADFKQFSYFKKNNAGQWKNIVEGVTINQDGTATVKFSLKDGGEFDADRTANGVIVDPGGVGENTLLPSLLENTKEVGTVSLLDDTAVSGVVSFAITGGADQGLFEIDASSGLLSFKAANLAPDYENPQDDGDTADNNTYAVQVTLTGSTRGAEIQNLIVTVLNVAETGDNSNTAPVIIGLRAEAQAVTVGTAAELDDIRVADADGNSLTVTLTATNGTIGGLEDVDSGTPGIQLAGNAVEISGALADATFTAAAAGSAGVSLSVVDTVTLGTPITTTGFYAITAAAAPQPAPEPDPTPAPAPAPAPSPSTNDGDNVPPATENLAPALSIPGAVVGDGNGDGVLDSQQSNVTSTPFRTTDQITQNPSAPQTFVTLASEGAGGSTTGTGAPVITSVEQRDAPADLPESMSAPLGLIAFTAELAEGASSGSFSLYVDPSLGVNGYWKQVDGVWINLASEAYGGRMVEEGGKLRLDFVIEDGGVFDADGEADGTITDPGAIGSMPLSITEHQPVVANDGFWF